MVFAMMLTIIVAQRFIELIVAKRNEVWMKRQGGVEYGEKHYPYIVLMHVLFFIVYIGEVQFLQRNLSPAWIVLLIVLILTQIGRVWALVSLGKYWNTKIMVVPNAQVICRGPYRFIKHPNYLVVAIEFIVIPLMFQGYGTAILFTILNIGMLSIRIPEEERALAIHTEYSQVFRSRSRLTQQ